MSLTRLHNLRYRARHNTHPHDPDFMEPVEGVWRCFDDRTGENGRESFEDLEDAKEWLE